MRPIAIVLLLVAIVCTLLLSLEAKLQQQAAIADDDDDDDDDDWDDDDEDDDGYAKPEVDDDGRIYKNPRNSPSAMCPRDEEQAGLLGQKCLRKCSTDEDCKSKKKKCRCDGACGMSCIKPERECPELNDIYHGKMTVTGRLFGDRADYTCDPDYFTVGLAERSCRADGQWTGSTPSCKKEHTSFCSDPPKIKNAKHNAPVEQTTFDLDTTVQYFCSHGYQTAGIAKAKCLMMDGIASWFGPDVTCEPRSCGAPAEITNGGHVGECYTYDCRISYRCVDDYELVGKTEKICLADGTWSPKELPQCVQVTAVQCPIPENPRHGKALYTSTVYNSIVSYECQYGYTIVGQATRRCSADRRWSGQAPMCKEINCGSPGILYNGWIDNIESGTGMGASLIFRCKEHMKLEGNTSSVCQSDGKWRYPLPHCLAPCVVPQIEKGKIAVASNDSDHINNVTVAEHGDKLIVSCIKNYEFAANNTPVVCTNGTWSIIPTCSPARCKQMPKTPKNGMVIAPKTDHGMRAVFKCKDGYTLVGGGPNNSSRQVECRYGNWTGDIPYCVEVYCSFPGYILNGKVLLVGNMGVYDYRPYVKKVPNNKQIMYDCDKGYVLSEGPPGATCVGGKWSPRELPACLPGQHPRLRWSRRRRSVDDEQKNNNTSSTTSYGKFIDFFRRIGKKLLHLELKKSQSAEGDKTGENESAITRSNTTEDTEGTEADTSHHIVDEKIEDEGFKTVINNSIDLPFIRKKHTGHKNKSRSKDEKMIDFLRVVYRKLRRIDSKRNNNGTNTTMHDLLNLMSKNFFHVDLAEPRKNNTGRSHESFQVRNQREFTKLKREFERIMKFYNKSLRWSEKQSRKESKKRRIDGHIDKKMRVTKDKKKKRNKSQSYYKGFYEFINGYVNEKLSILETQNGTDELVRKMNIDKFTVRNGTTFTVGEIYAFFKHIIENKLNIAEMAVEGATTTGSTFVTKELDNANDNQTLSTIGTLSTTKTVPQVESGLGNEIPTIVINKQHQQHEIKKHRTKRIRNAVEETTATYQNRKLLSVISPLSNVRPKSTVAQNFQRMSPEALAKSKKFTLNGLDAQQQSRSKRFLPPSELDNQIILKNLYLNAYEDEYRANIRRSISQNNRANWTALRRRKGNLDHYEIK